MDKLNKNKPPKALIAVVLVIALVIIFYLFLTVFFPQIFHQLNTGEMLPVNK